MFTQIDGSTVKGFYEERFGIPESVFDGCYYFESTKSYYVTRSHHMPGLISLKRIEFGGIRVLRKMKNRLKPTSYGLHLFGEQASRNVIDLSRDELAAVFKVPIPKDLEIMSNGYVVLRYNGNILGCGLFIDGRLIHQFPKGRATALSLSGFF